MNGSLKSPPRHAEPAPRPSPDITGDATGFEPFYQTFAPRVRGLVRKLVFDLDVGDDIVQETFLRAYNAGLHTEWAAGRDPRSQWPWLAAVARNQALDHIRRCGRVTEEPIDDEALLITIPDDEDPDVQLQAAQRRENIVEALTAVSSVCERQQRIFLMKHVEGKRYEEIAAAEGMSIQALKSVLYRARRLFKDSYVSIAERSGLGALVGGGLLGRLALRLRSLRDRMALGVGDGSLAAFGSSAAVNAVVAAVAVGATVVGGAAAGARPEAAPRLVPAASVVMADAAATLAAAASDRPSVSESAQVSAQAPAAPVAAPAGPAPAPAPAPEGHHASVDTNDVLPSQAPDAPANANGSGDVHHDNDGDLQVSLTRQVDVGDKKMSRGQGGIDIPCPDEQTPSPADSALCIIASVGT